MINKSEPEWVYKYNTVEEIVKESSKLRKKYSKMGDKINLLDKRLREICSHGNTTIKEEFIGGGYYDKAEYITKRICNDCGVEVSRSVEYGDYA